MQALASLPVDAMPAAQPAAASSASSGQDGLFASNLKAATEQQTASGSKTTGNTKKQPNAKVDAKDANPGKDTAMAATPNGSAGAAVQQAPNGNGAEAAVSPNPELAAARTMLAMNAIAAASVVAQQPPVGQHTENTGASEQNPAFPVAPTGESAVAKMLGALTAPTASDTTPIANTVQPVAPQGAAQPASMTQQQPVAAPLAAANVAGQQDAASPQPEITVTFTTVPTQAADPATQQQPVATHATEVQPNSPLIVQNTYGQILTIYQAGKGEEEASATASPGATAGSTGDGQPIDIENNYIRANLPNKTAQNTSEKGDGQSQNAPFQAKQEETVVSKGTTAEGLTTAEQALLQKAASAPGPESQPLVFAHHRFGEQPALSGATSASTSFTLPSGSTVPETTVVDQMIAHFSMNRRLETGTVNLKLYPQELGELRMEIKVTQDNVKAHIVAQNPQAQEMIDRHLPRLREALEQQGLHLQQVEVTLAAQDNATDGRFQESNAWQQPSSSPQRTVADQPVFTLETEEHADDDNAVASTLSVLV